MILGISNLKYYEILILQDEKHLEEHLWQPYTSKDKMPHVEGLFGVKKRYYIAPKVDGEKPFLRLVQLIVYLFAVCVTVYGYLCFD